MRIGILRTGNVDPYLIGRIQENLIDAFLKTSTVVIDQPMQIPQEALNEQRQQHRSDIILDKINSYAEKEKEFDRVLGIMDSDIYAPRLNFVFGQARCPGKAALISVWRLKEEFYKRNSNTELLVERGTKEAVHELGHTLGMEHCTNPFCVMYFSNSIFETDGKQTLFCNRCQQKIETRLKKQGEQT
jgi:archaemetzincin